MKSKGESKYVKLRDWDAVMAASGVLLSYAVTALLMSWPMAWLVNHTFAPGAIREVFGGHRLSYWQCVLVFAIWHCAKVRVTFPFTVHGKLQQC